MMNVRLVFRVSRMLLLATFVSLIILLLVYALQNPHVMMTIASIGWNGIMNA